MAIKIGNYRADGPYDNLAPVAGRSGVYIMLGRDKDAEPWKVLDIQAAILVKHCIAYHLRKGDYDGHDMLAVAVIKANSQQRGPIETELRALYSLPRKPG